MTNGLAGWACRERQTAIVHDTTTDARWLTLAAIPEVMRAALVVPILFGPQVLGVLTLGHPQPGHFGADKERLLAAAADQLALALRNAQFYETQRVLALELGHAKEAAEAASRAKSLFLAKMSHELRTPLTVILGYNEMLLEDAQEQGLAAFTPRLQKMHASAHHLLTLISEVLDYSKIEAGKLALQPETITLADFLTEIATTAQTLAAPHANHFVLHAAPHLGQMEADLTRLRQILLNLLSNAHKFTRAGTVTLTVTAEPPTRVSFCVADTGIGIAPEQQPHLFQPFNQADASITSQYGGTGLGLAITHQLCQLMGGQIELTSTLGQGTTVTVWLPRQPPSCSPPIIEL